MVMKELMMSDQKDDEEYMERLRQANDIFLDRGDGSGITQRTVNGREVTFIDGYALVDSGLTLSYKEFQKALEIMKDTKKYRELQERFLGKDFDIQTKNSPMEQDSQIDSSSSDNDLH